MYEKDDELQDTLNGKDSEYQRKDNGLVFYRTKIYLPPEFGAQMLYHCHDIPAAGHPGRNKTQELVQRVYDWPGTRRYIATYVKSCDTCQRVKVNRHAPYGLLKSLDVPVRNWTHISMDFGTGLPRVDGNDAILVVIDQRTKRSHFIACDIKFDSKRLADIFIDNIFKVHGALESIISDRGSVFVSEFWHHVTSTLGIQSKHSTAFHPRTDGQMEKVMPEVAGFLSCYIDYHQLD